MDNHYTIHFPLFYIFENGLLKDYKDNEFVNYDASQITFKKGDLIQVHIIHFINDGKEHAMTYTFANNSEVECIETRIVNDGTMVRHMQVGEQAVVNIILENQSDTKKEVVFKDEVHLQRDALVQSGYAELSEGSLQASYEYYLEGENASAKIRMAALSKGKENKQYKVLLKHDKPHTLGQMDNYGVVKDEAALTIDGIGTITKGQYGSETHQTNKIMVFDPECRASANPYLYIDEYDVKASHAAGVGKMDEEHLYYLQSRGLSSRQAMQLITYGYLRPVVDIIDNDALKEQFENALLKVGA